MQKAIYSLFTSVFVIGCLGLWLILNLCESIYPLRMMESLPGFTRCIYEKKFFFLMAPVPFLLFALVLLFSRKPTAETNLFYLGILMVIYSILIILVVVAVLLPWIPMIE